MKFYAKATSERASKGQGGNRYLEIKITGEDGQRLGELLITESKTSGVRGYGLNFTTANSRGLCEFIPRQQTKGNKQQTATLQTCRVCGKDKLCLDPNGNCQECNQ